MRRLVLIAVLVIITGVALGGLARQGVFPEPKSGEAVAAYPETTITLLWCHELLSPNRIRVPKDCQVTFIVETTASESPGELRIPGYGEQFEAIRIEPGEKRRTAFRTRLPGDGFEIYVGEKVAGRLDVTGDHVQEDRL